MNHQTSRIIRRNFQLEKRYVSGPLGIGEGRNRARPSASDFREDFVIFHDLHLHCPARSRPGFSKLSLPPSGGDMNLYVIGLVLSPISGTSSTLRRRSKPPRPLRVRNKLPLMIVNRDAKSASAHCSYRAQKLQCKMDSHVPQVFVADSNNH